MLPIDDDAELNAMVQEGNAKLEAEMEAEGGDAGGGITPITSVEELIKASRPAVTLKEFDEVPSVHDELTRLDAKTELDLPEEFAVDEVEIKPAENLADFRDAVALAEINGLKSIQASRKVIFHFTKPTYPKDGFFFYHGIRIDEAGKTEEIERLLSMTTEEVNFGRPR